MPHILTTLVPIIIVAALLQILLFALPLLYFRWHYMLNSLESFLAISLMYAPPLPIPTNQTN